MDDKVELAEGDLIPLVETWSDMSSTMQKRNVRTEPGGLETLFSTRLSKTTHNSILLSKTRIVEPEQEWPFGLLHRYLACSTSYGTESCQES